MTSQTEARAGAAMGIAAYTIWGLLPLYLKALQPLPAATILGIRVLWSLLFLALLATALRKTSFVAAFRQPRLIGALVATALLIGANWLIYIIAIETGHVLQASLGYFINPLLNVLLGVVILRERLGRAEIVAVALAGAGVALLAIWQQSLPLISLALALTFGLYGLVRKMIPVDAIDGLLIETILLASPAMIWLATHQGFASVPGGPPLWLLALGGIVTTAPLLLFTAAAKRMRYADLALLQYIAPTLQLNLALFVFGEPLQPIHLPVFALIWAGLLVYAIATWRRGRTAQVMPPE